MTHTSISEIRFNEIVAITATGFLPFRQEYENSSGRNYKTLKAIYEIIRIVVCWEEERE